MAETLLAFDFGEQRIGVAVGNDLVCHAEALETVHAATVEARFARIGALIREWQPQRLVVGIATAADGAALPVTQRCERFANQLHGRYGLPVERVDERYSSVDAETLHRERRKDGRAARKDDIDHHAAAIILQRYFESLHAANP